MIVNVKDYFLHYIKCALNKKLHYPNIKSVKNVHYIKCALNNSPPFGLEFQRDISLSGARKNFQMKSELMLWV